MKPYQIMAAHSTLHCFTMNSWFAKYNQPSIATGSTSVDLINSACVLIVYRVISFLSLFPKQYGIHTYIEFTLH
jgi:hypothetical protein